MHNIEIISNTKIAPKTSRNKQINSPLMINLDLPVSSFTQIISKNPNIVNSIDNQGETLLSYAIKQKKNDICQIILTSKILDLNYQDKNGNSYLHLAVLYKLEKLAQALIMKGININKQNKNGNTSLHLAFLNNNDSMISILKNNKADFNMRNKDNQIPEELRNTKKSENIQITSRGRTTKDNSKVKDKSNNNSNLTAKSTNKNNVKRNGNVKSIKESQNNSNNLKVSLFDYEAKSNIKKIESLPTLRDMQQKQKKDRKKINKFTSLYFIEKTDIGKKPKYKKLMKNNSIKDKKLNEENNINKKKIRSDTGNNSSEIKMKSGNKKDKLSKKNNIEESETLKNIHIINFKKEDDIFGLGDSGDFEKQLEFTSDLNNDFNKYHFFNLNKDKYFQEEDEVKKKEAYERINKKYIDEIIKNSKNNNEKDSDDNDNEKNSQIKEDDEYCVRFEDSDSSDEEINEKNKSLNMLESSLILNQNNKNNIHKISRNNNNEDHMKLKCETNLGNYFFDNTDEKQFSKTLVKKSIDQKLDTLSNKSSDDNNNEFENELEYQLYPDKGQKYTHNPHNLLNNNLGNNEDAETYKNKISEDLKEPNLLPESDQIPKDIQELEDIVKNNSLKEFLLQINMQKYINNFIESGFDDMKFIIEQAQKGIYIKDSELKEAGILIPGDRAKLLIRIQEKAGNFKFDVPKSVYYSCKNMKKLNNDNNIMNLKQWLKNLRIDNYLKNFITNGYHSIELLFLQMESQCPLTAEILKDEIGIDKIGHRSRIINKLKEDARSYINQLKTSVLLVGNGNNSKFCDCIIF